MGNVAQRCDGVVAQINRVQLVLGHTQVFDRWNVESLIQNKTKPGQGREGASPRSATCVLPIELLRDDEPLRSSSLSLSALK